MGAFVLAAAQVIDSILPPRGINSSLVPLPNHDFHVTCSGARPLSLSFVDITSATIPAGIKAFLSCHFIFRFLPTASPLVTTRDLLHLSDVFSVSCRALPTFPSQTWVVSQENAVSFPSSFLLQTFAGSLTPILEWMLCGYTGSWAIVSTCFGGGS